MRDGIPTGHRKQRIFGAAGQLDLAHPSYPLRFFPKDFWLSQWDQRCSAFLHLDLVFACLQAFRSLGSLTASSGNKSSAMRCSYSANNLALDPPAGGMNDPDSEPGHLTFVAASERKLQGKLHARSACVINALAQPLSSILASAMDIASCLDETFALCPIPGAKAGPVQQHMRHCQPERCGLAGSDH